MMLVDYDWKAAKLHLIFLVAKLLYNYLCPSVRMSVRLSGLGGNVISQAVIKKEVQFFCVDSSYR